MCESACVRGGVHACVCVCARVHAHWEAESKSRAAVVLLCAAVRSSGGHSQRGSDRMAGDNGETISFAK